MPSAAMNCTWRTPPSDRASSSPETQMRVEEGGRVPMKMMFVKKRRSTVSQKIVTLMLREKTLVKVSDDLVFYGKVLEDLRERVRGLKVISPGAQPRKIDVARFKELTGVSRKYAIPLLEWLDRERVTRRVGDERMIL